MSKELRDKATLYYNNFLFFKKKSKQLFKKIIIYINDNNILLKSEIKDNIKILISKWNNTDNYSGQDYLDMKNISDTINNKLDNNELHIKDLFSIYLSNFDRFQKDLYNFYEYAEKIKEMEIIIKE